MSGNIRTVGIVGLGGVAQAHLQAINLLDNLNIVSVCDIQPGLAQKVAEISGATAYENYRNLIAAGGIQLLMVLTPASTHREIVEAAAAASLPVFCEKPIAVTLEDAEAMVMACEKADVKFFYGSSYRYLPAVKKAKQLIDTGAIGNIQLMTEQLIGGNGLANYCELSPIHYPLGGPGGPGMGLVDHGVHLIDVFSWYADSDIVSVQGRGLISGGPPVSEFMVMQFANGAIGHLLYNAATFSTALPNEGMFSGGQGWLADGTITEVGLWESDPGSLSVYGDTGSLRIFHYTNALFINTGNGSQKIELDGRPAFGHFATQLEDCLTAISEGREPSVTGVEGIKALKVLLKVYSQISPSDVIASQ